MKKRKALIIEDNPLMATVLSDLIQENHPQMEILGVGSNGKEALKLISQYAPDLLFLDIELPDMNGFEMLDLVPTISFKTIFTTSHSHYAIKAFRFNALDYLVKPIDPSELKEAIRRFTTSSEAANSKQIKDALQNFHTSDVNEQRLILQTQNGYLKLPLKHIITIESDRNYSYVHLRNGEKELSSKTLGFFEEVLEGKGFFRPHRSYLINSQHIASMENDNFILKNGVSIPISRRKMKEAKLFWAEIK